MTLLILLLPPRPFQTSATFDAHHRIEPDPNTPKVTEPDPAGRYQGT